jgi:hypothetical protein
MAKVLKNFGKVFDILPIFFSELEFIQRVQVPYARGRARSISKWQAGCGRPQQ